MKKERKPVKNGGDVGTKLCGVTTSWAAAPEVLRHRQMIAPADKRSVVFFLHPWFGPIRIQQCTWQWCPTGRECTSLRDVLPLRCSLLPSLWSGDSNYIGGGRWGWTNIELLVKGDLDVGHAAMLHHGSHRVHGDGVRGCQADFLHVRLQDSLGID